jgi:DNA-binding IclR family transcriptional regulator
MGKALLAHSSPAVVDRFLRRGLPAYTPYTITSAASFRRTLTLIRRTRVAVVWQELEFARGGLAVPVLDAMGQAVAAIEICVDNPSAELPLVRPTLLLAGHRLTRELAFARVVGERA